VALVTYLQVSSRHVNIDHITIRSYLLTFMQVK
jgi:hypothetical protein